jgi:oxepin-CoA hydrolase / 3-oxo-5,6-dehydrosuberyl-CoA semialdehyde dehydrogenase
VVVIENIITISLVSVEAGTQHGRVLVLDRDDAEESTGHGSLTPTLELQIADTIVGGPRTVTLKDISHFAEFTGNTVHAHTDRAAAAEYPLFGEMVAHGCLVVSLAAGPFVEPNPVPVLANFGSDGLRCLTPVRAGNALTVTLTAKQLTPRLSADYGEVRWDAVVTNQDDAAVATYGVPTLAAKLPAESNARES